MKQDNVNDFTFRLRFRLSQRSAIDIKETTLDLSQVYGKEMILSSFDKHESIYEAKELYISSGGFPSEGKALEAGKQVNNALILTLASLRTGAYFGERGNAGGFTEAGFEWLRKQTGISGKILNDTLGLAAHESNPVPKFASTGEPTLSMVSSQDRFLNLFTKALKIRQPLSERHLLAYELFSASFFVKSEIARLLFLVMSVEALMELKPRPSASVTHVNRLIFITLCAAKLSMAERMSIIGSLKWLKKESIGQAGRRLAKGRLSGRKYMDKPADRFFTYCYHLRSKLVHGEVHPPRVEIGRAAANLEVFVSDLLSGPLIAD
jgi:hypothetical protein